MTDKLDSFVKPDSNLIAGIDLKPLSAGRLAILQRVNNPLLVKSSSEVADNELVYHMAAFIYVLHDDIEKLRAMSRNPDLFDKSVIAFMDDLNISDIAKMSESIQAIINEAMVGQDYEAEGESSDPN